MTKWILLLLLVFLLAVYLYAITPSLFRKKECRKFAAWNYAHRGLWNMEKGIPENSLPAFARAAKHGYAVELDVQLTRDRQLVVFHDDQLRRMCGVSGKISDYTLEELKKYRLKDTCCRIPAFREVLETIGGKVPLLIEVKMPGRDPLICAVLKETLAAYEGAFCIESFNSLALLWCREHMPDVMRGQLSSRFRASDGPHLILRILATQLMLNFVGRPDFIAYDHRYADNPGFWLNRYLFRVPTFAWTIKNKTAMEWMHGKFDAAIFENFLPPGRIRTVC